MVKKVAVTANPADILTKYLAVDSAERMVKFMGLELKWRPGARRARAEGVCER